ncbi:Peptidoglycan-associated lipoprotein precursor [Candidatus Arsenophonus lipoptenae]|uniref:Peptidoglycan-associated lipoprotein n=1 Tax=Candidatus Arsenophonus lipoptenae TaxID=634113 RepID=A0A0X9VDF2_9GAMM|nr:peptidoglycan-associated lipoprotein Pal [Candidatus Arsenophonus lipoptenae]AMA64599.1 Peptidoglycan-associated lipoprotein precursor [Candidatus Arsenophonus lipoptenae]
MQLNKIITIILSIITITACNFKKINKKNIVDNGSFISREILNNNIKEIVNKNIIYFDFNNYYISQEYINLLDRYVFFLRQHPFIHIKIQGHTDELGSPEYNIALGERRATIVKLYFQCHGVDSDQIFIISYGKEKPAVLGHNETSYAKNRRVVLQIL